VGSGVAPVGLGPGAASGAHVDPWARAEAAGAGRNRMAARVACVGLCPSPPRGMAAVAPRMAALGRPHETGRNDPVGHVAGQRGRLPMDRAGSTSGWREPQRRATIPPHAGGVGGHGPRSRPPRRAHPLSGPRATPARRGSPDGAEPEAASVVHLGASGMTERALGLVPVDLFVGQRRLRRWLAPTERWVTPREAASLLGVSERRVRRMMQDGRVPTNRRRPYLVLLRSVLTYPRSRYRHRNRRRAWRIWRMRKADLERLVGDLTSAIETALDAIADGDLRRAVTILRQAVAEEEARGGTPQDDEA